MAPRQRAAALDPVGFIHSLWWALVAGDERIRRALPCWAKLSRDLEEEATVAIDGEIHEVGYYQPCRLKPPIRTTPAAGSIHTSTPA